jgi:hypothetical protein
MNYKKECSFSARLEEGIVSEYKVVVAETELKTARFIRMDIFGTEDSLRTYLSEWCMDCAVGNKTKYMVPMVDGDNKVFSFSCLVPTDYRRIRLCDIDDSIGSDEDDFKVADDNWYGIGTNDMDELYQEATNYSKKKVGQVTEELVMRTDPDFGIVITNISGRVILSGKGRDVLDFWQNICRECSANPEKRDEETTLPDFDSGHFFSLDCQPKKGESNFRVCDITSFV